MDTDVWVRFDVGATADEVSAVDAAFAEAGIPALVSDGPYSLTASAFVDETSTFVVVTSAATVAIFLGQFVKNAADDAYEGLGRLIRRLRSARRRDAGRLEVILRGEAGGPDVQVLPDTPESALGVLLMLPSLPPAPSGSLVYDAELQRWRDSEDGHRGQLS